MSRYEELRRALIRLLVGFQSRRYSKFLWQCLDKSFVKACVCVRFFSKLISKD
jgi:hypothetical protein